MVAASPPTGHVKPGNVVDHELGGVGDDEVLVCLCFPRVVIELL